MHSCVSFSLNRNTLFLYPILIGHPFPPDCLSSNNHHLDNCLLPGQYPMHRYFLVLAETRWINMDRVANVHFHHRSISLRDVSVRSMIMLHHYRTSLRTFSHSEVFSSAYFPTSRSPSTDHDGHCVTSIRVEYGS